MLDADRESMNPDPKHYKKCVCNKGIADTGNHTCTWPGIEAAVSSRVVPQCRDGTASEGNASPPPIKKNQHR
jgi:hypothetical protein